MHIGYWWERHKERDHWKDEGVGVDLREIRWDSMD
jgi:hypothetical protein